MLGTEHPTYLISLGAVLSEMERYEEAELLATETLKLRWKIRGDEHPYTQQSRFMMAVMVARRGAYDEALNHLRIAVEHGFAHPYLLDEDTLEILKPLQGRPESRQILS